MKRLTIDKNNAIKEHGKMADWNHLFFVRDRGSSVGSINGTKISNKWKYSIVIHITGEVIEKRAGSTLEGAVEKFKVELKTLTLEPFRALANDFITSVKNVNL